MLYAILCYAREDLIDAWDMSEANPVIARLAAVEDRLAAQGRMGPTLRLLPTTSATTLRKGRDQKVLDGPFAETKEQLLGFFVIDCDDLEAAIDAAKDLAVANPVPGAYEIRPMLGMKPSRL